MRIIFLIISFAIVSKLSAQEQVWKSGIELGTGLSFTGYNANLAYTGTFGENVVFAGPKLVYSDANALFETPWGLHVGYRRLFRTTSRFRVFASLEYQMVFFKYEGLKTSTLNSIHEFHFSYGLECFFNDHWSIGNNVAAGGYLERLVDPLDGRVDIFSGYSAHIRIFCGYHF